MLLPHLAQFLPLTNPLGMGASDLIELALAALLLALALAWRPWWEPYAARLAQKPAWCVLLLGALPVAVGKLRMPMFRSAWPNHAVKVLPSFEDERSFSRLLGFLFLPFSAASRSPKLGFRASHPRLPPPGRPVVTPITPLRASSRTGCRRVPCQAPDALRRQASARRCPKSNGSRRPSPDGRTSAPSGRCRVPFPQWRASRHRRFRVMPAELQRCKGRPDE